MPTEIAEKSHIRLDEKGRPWIEGTQVKVIEIVLDHIAWGMTPAQICSEHYGSPTMAEIHAALTYYYDHKAEMDAEIERLDREFDAMRHAAGESQAVKKLRAKGLLP
jgi:uncharacterized protein (DUF433 family)